MNALRTKSGESDLPLQTSAALPLETCFLLVFVTAFVSMYRHFAAADARRFEEVWLMIEEEVNHLAQRALAIDSVISQQLYGSPESQTDLNLLLLSSPFRPWKTRTEIVQTELQLVESPAESHVENLDTTGSTEEELVFTDSGPEWEDEKLNEEMQDELRELLCNEMVGY